MQERAVPNASVATVRRSVRAAILAGCAAAALAVGGCADPYGRSNPAGGALFGGLLGAGVGALGSEAFYGGRGHRRRSYGGYGGYGHGGYGHLPPVAAPYGGRHYGAPYGYGAYPGVRW